MKPCKNNFTCQTIFTTLLLSGNKLVTFYGQSIQFFVLVTSNLIHKNVPHNANLCCRMLAHKSATLKSDESNRSFKPALCPNLASDSSLTRASKRYYFVYESCLRQPQCTEATTNAKRPALRNLVYDYEY